MVPLEYGSADKVFARIELDRPSIAASHVGHEGRKRCRTLCIAEDKDLLDGGPAHSLPRRVEKLGNGDQIRRARILQLRAELLRRVRRVDRRADTASGGDAKERDRVLGEVGTVDRKHVTLGESARRQSGCCACDRVPELGVCECSVRRTIDQRRLVGPTVGMLEHRKLAETSSEYQCRETGCDRSSIPQWSLADHELMLVPPSTGMTAPFV